VSYPDPASAWAPSGDGTALPVEVGSPGGVGAHSRSRAARQLHLPQRIVQTD